MGAGLDPCGVLQTPLELAAAKPPKSFSSWAKRPARPTRRFLITHYRAVDLDAAFREVMRLWDDLLGTVQVKTPDRAMDLMLNRWLLYQTLVCRRVGALGILSGQRRLRFPRPASGRHGARASRGRSDARALLRAAARQFVEGDVQHWWLPPFGQGVRTRISDDRIWLAYGVAHYVDVTGDLRACSTNRSPFLEGQTLQPGEHDAYFQPDHLRRVGHALRALRARARSKPRSRHARPAADRHGRLERRHEHGRRPGQGRERLARLVPARGAVGFRAAGGNARGSGARRGLAVAYRALQAALERDGWDGDWYRRAYFDDGTPLGSSVNNECRIDSIVQSWSVISGAADPGHAMRAHGGRRRSAHPARQRLGADLHPALRPDAARPGLHQGLSAGHPREWRAIYPCRRLVGDRTCDAWRRRQGGELFSLLNPINHSSTRAGLQRYKVEPYVVAADVYSEPPHVGRGGWTWYTGSAGWMYRAGIESILGLRRRGAFLILSPCIPKHWPCFEIAFRHGSTRYEIMVENPHGVSRGIASAEIDGQPLSGAPLRVLLADDGHTHRIRVVLG